LDFLPSLSLSSSVVFRQKSRIMFEPIRGGTRGGQAEFKWSDVSADKDRENYLGHSINAPTGRWQKNKDVHWYNRDKNQTDDERKEELKKIKEAEAEALGAALGFGPSKPGLPGNPTSTTTGASGSNSIPVPVRDKPGNPVESEEEKAERQLRKAEKKARKEERRMRRIERAERRARSGRRGSDGDRSRSRDRSTRSRSPVRRDRERERGDEREYCRSRRPRSRSRTPPRRDSYGERERDRRRWDESSRR